MSSSASSGGDHNLRSESYLIGSSSSEILGAKLPSKHQILQYFLYAMETEKNPLQSAKLTFEAVKPFYLRAGIPTLDGDYAAQKIKRFYETYKMLQKSSKNKLEMNSATFRGREAKFIDELEDIFDLAATDLSRVSEESKHFLFQQRLKGRPGSMPSTRLQSSATLETIDESVLEESDLGAAASSLASRSDETPSGIESTGSFTGLSSSSSVADSRHEPDSDFEISDYVKIRKEPTTTVPIPPVLLNKNFLTERLIGTLDRYKISDYAAVHLIIAILLGLGLDPMKFVCSRASIQKARAKGRENIATDIKEKFKAKVIGGATVHWDGKAMENILNHETKERLPVKITASGGVDQLLGVPEIDDGTGESIANAVYAMLVQWEQTETVQCSCYDTTSSNTGCWQGAAVLLEQLLGRSLLSCPCRHHIAEVLLGGAFTLKVEPEKKSADVTMFKTFHENWDQLDHGRYKSGIRDRYIKEKLQNENLEVFKGWVRDQLEKPICRYDYRELLELCLLFLGEPIPHSERRTSPFHRPGAMHHARWMSKALYSLKMCMFRDQIHLTEQQKIGLADICVFLIRFYVMYWFKCVSPIEAPRQDLTFIKNVYNTKDVDPQLSDELIRKMANHLWYLADETIAFAFFDKKVSLTEKRKMVARLKVESNDYEPNKRVVLDIKEIKAFVKKDLSDFVSANTLQFFERFKINKEFLEHDPSTWMDREDYKQTTLQMKSIKVIVNDEWKAKYHQADCEFDANVFQYFATPGFYRFYADLYNNGNHATGIVVRGSVHEK